MWEELLSVISDRDYPLESMQETIAGYVDPDKGWDLTRVNPWFTEHGYEFVGYLDLFSENEPSDVYVNVDGCVWRCRTNAHDNSIYWYFEPEDDEWTDLDELRFLHGYAHMFIWDADNKVCRVINIAE